MFWREAATYLEGGRWRLVITKLTAGGRAVDVTSFRGHQTGIDEFTDTDPFGDATAQFTFPGITPFDDLDASDLSQWLGYYSNVDLYWMPAITPVDDRYGGVERVISALTGQASVVCPVYTRDAGGVANGWNQVKVFEGFIADLGFSDDDSSATLRVQAQGAFFQVDRYLAKPFYPAQPWPLELLIADAFDSLPGAKVRPHLRTRKLITTFPAGWKLKVPKYTGNTTFTPVGKPGSLWTGYTSRQTGSWDHALTGFVQDRLSEMITDERSGVTVGNQWTITHRHGGYRLPGRQPILEIRDRFRSPDFALWLGTPGVKVRLDGDSTQSENIVYGDGTSVDGVVWRNAVISNDGRRTDYLPLAAAREVYPLEDNPAFVKGGFASEAYTKYGTGFDQPDATTAAGKQLARDRKPGWTGSITLTIDPDTMSRWCIRAGMTVLLKGFLGTGAKGFPFHIASTRKSPNDGSVELTVDSRYRDLLTVEEAKQRTRDPLTPIKMLQVNRTSVLIEDIQAPWDYAAGSGYIPRASKRFHDYRPRSDGYPYTSWAEKHPPLHYHDWYVKVNANAPTRWGRWTRKSILTSEKDTIIRSEFYASDVYGRPLKVPFHVSIYYTPVDPSNMPRDGSGPSPYIDGAFESVNPLTGQSWPAGNFLAPDQFFIVGWGNRSRGVFDRAGFWPARESDGASPTGRLVDDASWSFDNTSNPDYDRLAKPGARQRTSAITLYAMFYCEYKEPVCFQGRLFRQNPGVS